MLWWLNMYKANFGLEQIWMDGILGEKRALSHTIIAIM